MGDERSSISENGQSRPYYERYTYKNRLPMNDIKKLLAYVDNFDKIEMQFENKSRCYSIATLLNYKVSWKNKRIRSLDILIQQAIVLGPQYWLTVLKELNCLSCLESKISERVCVKNEIMSKNKTAVHF